MAKVSITGGGIAALAVAAAGLYVYSQRDKIVKAAVAAVNPADPNNLVNIAANKAFNAAVGSQPGQETSIGSWLYDLKSKYFPSESDKILQRWAAENAAAGQKPPSFVGPTLEGVELTKAMNAEAWIGLAALGFALYVHTSNKRKHRE